MRVRARGRWDWRVYFREGDAGAYGKKSLGETHTHKRQVAHAQHKTAPAIGPKKKKRKKK